MGKSISKIQQQLYSRLFFFFNLTSYHYFKNTLSFGQRTLSLAIYVLHIRRHISYSVKSSGFCIRHLVHLSDVYSLKMPYY